MGGGEDSQGAVSSLLDVSGDEGAEEGGAFDKVATSLGRGLEVVIKTPRQWMWVCGLSHESCQSFPICSLALDKTVPIKD